METNRTHWEDVDLDKEGFGGWSSAWGGAAPQWYCSILPRIQSFIPCESILEIAPGWGRWTRYLLPFATKCFRGIDISKKCVEVCQDRFPSLHPDCQVFQNDGLSLKDVADRSYDFIFSYDSLVHVGLDVMESYIKQILNGLLNKNGICFLHHSNLKYVLEHNLLDPVWKNHWRDASVSAKEVENLIDANGGRLLLQEIINWDEGPYLDALTVFCNGTSDRQPAPVKRLDNPGFFSVEAANAKKYIAPYCFEKADGNSAETV